MPVLPSTCITNVILDDEVALRAARTRPHPEPHPTMQVVHQGLLGLILDVLLCQRVRRQLPVAGREDIAARQYKTTK